MCILKLILVSLTLQQTVFAVPVNTGNTGGGNDNSPLFEHQLAAWPIDLPFDELESSMFDEAVIGNDEIPWNDNETEKDIQLYEDQLVVFPEEYDELDGSSQPGIWPVGPHMSAHIPLANNQQPVVVIQNDHKVNADGTSEYKLVLSNGMQDYKKIYKKIVNGQVVQVQEGYYSVPVANNRNQFQTLHYTSDEKGHRVIIG